MSKLIESLETRRLFSTPTLATANVTVKEGLSGFAAVVVRLSKKTTHLVKVSYTTKSATAVSGADFVAHRGTLQIPAGKTVGTIEIPILTNSTLTTNAKFYVSFLSAVHAIIPSGGLFSRITVRPATNSGGTTIDLSDNLSANSGGTQFASGSTYLAASFTTASSLALKNVSLLLQQTSGAAVVDIYSDAGGQPGSSVGTLTSPSTYSTTVAPTVFASTNGVALTSDSTYWVVLRVPSGTFNWSFGSQISGGGSGSGFTNTWAYSQNAGALWSVNHSTPLQMSVAVT